MDGLTRAATQANDPTPPTNSWSPADRRNSHLLNYIKFFLCLSLGLLSDECLSGEFTVSGGRSLNLWVALDRRQQSKGN